mmetsp:Transcript_11009/g.17302  ORF Transcript_11009/g.17302 Transcript_11009/m.17302 type:complete len:115 (+) Transcript_11009:346-690(+)
MPDPIHCWRELEGRLLMTNRMIRLLSPQQATAQMDPRRAHGAHLCHHVGLLMLCERSRGETVPCQNEQPAAPACKVPHIADSRCFSFLQAQRKVDNLIMFSSTSWLFVLFGSSP